MSCRAPPPPGPRLGDGFVAVVTVPWGSSNLLERAVISYFVAPVARFHRCIAVIRRALGLCDCGWGRGFAAAGNERRWDRSALVSPRHHNGSRNHTPPDRWFSVAEDNHACVCEGVRLLVKALAISLAEFAYTCTDMRRPYDAEAMCVLGTATNGGVSKDLCAGGHSTTSLTLPTCTGV